jgi:uncharacterized RDD family membrane protein YckC
VAGPRPAPAAGASPVDAPAGSLPDAGLWRRAMSATYESIVLFGVVVFFGYAYSALLQYRGEPGALRWGLQAWLFLVLGVYFVWFWSEGRRTLPMRTVGVRLLADDDRPPGRGRAAARYTAAWAMLLAPIWAATGTGHPAWLLLWPVPFFWGLFDARRRTLYDRVAGTRLVVDTRPVA